MANKKSLKKKGGGTVFDKNPASIPGTVARSERIGDFKQVSPTKLCLIRAIFFMVILSVFWVCMDNDFINLDDNIYLTENPQVKQGLKFESIKWAFTSFDATNWHPLTWLSEMFAVSIFGLKPAGHHLLNVILHALNGTILFLILTKITGRTWRALAVAALFALHPLRVESVAWAAERKDVLSAFFWLLTIWAHACYAQALQSKGKLLHFYFLALGVFVLALLSKPMVVTLPFTLLLLDYWPLKRTSRWQAVWLEKIPYFILTFASCCVTYYAQKSGGAVSAKVPMTFRLQTAVISYFRYIGKEFWPVKLVIPYPYPHHWPEVALLLSISGLVTISALAIIYRKKLPWLPVGWFWYLGTLVPVIGLVQVGVQSIADRYTYIPGIGIALIAVWGFSEMCAAWKFPKPLPYAAAGACLGILAIMTHTQIGYWHDSKTLFTHSLGLTTNNYTASECLAAYEYNHNNLNAALTYSLETLKSDPGNETALKLSSYILFFNAGQRDSAIQLLEQSLTVKPNSPGLHNNLGMFYKEQRRYSEAESQFREVLRLKSDFMEAYVGLAYICLKDGRKDEGISLLKQALVLRPDLAVAKKMLLQATGEIVP